MTLDLTDRRMLEEVLAEAREDETRFRVSVFNRWLVEDAALSTKQRSWLRDAHEKVTGTPNYVNMASSGKLVPGKEVASMVKDHPLRPPQRRIE